MMPFEIRMVPVGATRLLRQRILRPQELPENLVLPGDELVDAFHLAAYDAGEQVGIVSLYPLPSPGVRQEPSWQLRMMGVLPERQGEGIGLLLAERAIAELGQRGAATVWCNARERARAFYERLGFQAEGPRFDMPGIGAHVYMWRAVNRPD